MPETKAQGSAAGRKAAATRKRHAAESKRREQARTVVDRTTELSDEVLDSLESAQRAAIEAVGKFVDTVDQTLPPHGETPSRRQEVIDGAMEMAERLVHVQYDFLRKAVTSASESLGRSNDGK